MTVSLCLPLGVNVYGPVCRSPRGGGDVSCRASACETNGPEPEPRAGRDGSGAEDRRILLVSTQLAALCTLHRGDVMRGGGVVMQSRCPELAASRRRVRQGND